MKKTIKISTEELRKLIKESIQVREPGSPLFTPPRRSEKKHTIDENQQYEDHDVRQFVSAVRIHWVSMYNPSDPVMAEMDKEDWDDQVDAAVQDLELQISDEFERIEKSLFDGEYSRYAV